MKNNPQKVMKYGSESGNQNNTDQPSGSASNTQKNVAPFKNHKYPLFKNPKRFEPYLRLIFNIKRPQ